MISAPAAVFRCCCRDHLDRTEPGLRTLARGHQLGFVGSTDHRYGATYVGVYCRELTRELVFDALRERRCFAASARGVEPYIAIGAATMGRAVPYAAEASIKIGGGELAS